MHRRLAGSAVDGVNTRADRIVKERDSALRDVPKPDSEPGSVRFFHDRGDRRTVMIP
jgi:hypothetical protein